MERELRACRGCGKDLLPDNAWMEDGCPCNSPKGINEVPSEAWKSRMSQVDDSSCSVGGLFVDQCDDLTRRTSEVKSFAEDGVIQLHWQKIDEPSKTQMVAQGGEFQTCEELQSWLQSMLSEKKKECPDGWQPVICDSNSDLFWWAAIDEKEEPA